MNKPPLREIGATCLFAIAVAIGGCSNPDAPTADRRPRSSIQVQNAGEPPAPSPASPLSETPAGVQATPTAALAAFSRLYSNWNYRTLTDNQRKLAAMSLSAARLAEKQATASSRADTTIVGGHIWNTGQIISIANDIAQPGIWTIVTREQTGGSTQYEGLPATYHITLARLASLPNGYAVSEWLPQS